MQHVSLSYSHHSMRLTPPAGCKSVLLTCYIYRCRSSSSSSTVCTMRAFTCLRPQSCAREICKGCAFYCTDCTDSSSIPPAPHCSTLCHGFHFLECLSPHLRRALARKQQGLDAYLSPDLRTYASSLSLQVMTMTTPSRLPPWQSPTFSGSTSLRPAG